MSASDERILRLLQDARRQLESERARRTAPIAIVGMGCRFPGGGSSPRRFWQLLRDGVDATIEVPADRWDVDAFFDADPETPGTSYAKRGGFLKRIADFEPEFFGISPREATAMDPQQRLLLEVVWEALEDAGIASDRLDGSASGVWMGLCFDDYARRSVTSGEPGRIDAYSALGNSRAVAVGRIAYVFGLRGPAMQLDTTCSSSLVALHLACQSLRARECDLALAGGVNLISSPEASIAFSKLRALSPDGRCKTFDAGADGYARGEGCGVVVLKRLADTDTAGDRIYAVVRGSAINHDGHSNGLTAPNGAAQEEVIRAALANAGLTPADVDYVEAHGTGTPLGDPIEVLALGRAYGPRPSDVPLWIGSVKTNFGHLEAAAGVAGLMKLALCLSHGELAPHLHFRTPNPRIPWDSVPVSVADARRPWPRRDAPRRGGVSAFGMSGTNVHVIVEEPPPRPAPAASGHTAHLITLSARTQPALASLAGNYDLLLASTSDAELAGVCATANSGRAALAHRVAVVGANGAELRAGLQSVAAGSRSGHGAGGVVTRGKSPRVAFLFSGQGAQYAGMGRELYETEPIYRAALDRCAACADGPILEIVLGSAGDTARVHDTGWTQPALFAVEYALAELWRAWGVTPSAVIGHSVGELVAATVAGVFGLEEGFRLVAARGRAMQTHMSPGAMAAVLAAPATVLAMLADFPDVVIASLNGPRHTVVSGPGAAIDAVAAGLAHEGIVTKRLQTRLAFHSAACDPALPELRRAAEAARSKPAGCTIISNLTGEPTESNLDFASPDYWCRHAREPVRFGDGMAALVREGYEVFVEIGPTPTLLPMARTVPGGALLTWLPSLVPGQSDWRRLLTTLGALWTRGAACDPAAIDQRHVVSLPTYPFQRRTFWMDLPGRRATGAGGVRPYVERRSEEVGPAPTRVRDAILAARPEARRGKLEAFVRDKVSAALGLAPGELDLTRSLKDLGIDSLMLVSLDMAIREDLGLDVPVQELARADGATMVETLWHLLSSESGVDLSEAVDLTGEAVLDDAIAGGRGAPAGIATVLLTGATGFLGAFILAELLGQTEAHVMCLVRASGAQAGLARVVANLRQYRLWDDSMAPRISAIPGDLAEPRLGQTESAFAALADRVDAIYNNGAHVSYVATYHALKPSHVGGTREVLRLASIGRPKAVHHISSIAAYEAAAYRGQTMAEGMSPVESRGIHLAYSRCKWVSEALVRAARERGVPVTIYRPSLVSGSSGSGAWNTNDFLCRMLKGIIEMGCIPSGLDLQLDFSPVDYVGKSVVYLSRQPASLGQAFHLHHPQGVDWMAFGEMIADLGYEIEFVSHAEWLERLEARRDGTLYPLLPFFRQRWAPDRLTYIELNQRGYRPLLTCDGTVPTLAAAGIRCPPIDLALIGRYVQYLVDVGFLVPAPRTIGR